MQLSALFEITLECADSLGRRNRSVSSRHSARNHETKCEFWQEPIRRVPTIAPPLRDEREPTVHAGPLLPSSDTRILCGLVIANAL